MVSYTKEQRHRIYKYAKKAYVQYAEREGTKQIVGMCRCLCFAIEKLFNNDRYGTEKQLVRDLPEFKALVPEERYSPGFWYHPLNRELRIRDFDLLIKQTE